MATVVDVRARALDRALMDRLVPQGWAADLAVVVAGVAFLAVAAQIRVPLPFTPVPITGQTLAVLLVGGAFGARRGVASVVAYLAIGIAGVPVFTNGGAGFASLAGPTGGYLVGFAVAAALVGALADRGALRHLVPALGAMALASLVIYGFGATGLMLTTGVSLFRAIELGILPFLAGDALKTVIAGVSLPAASGLVTLAEGRR